MELFKNFIKENKEEYITLIHITTPVIASEISTKGFIPSPFLEYKYYSDLGKDGIYFYKYKRQSQSYAYFLSNKVKIDKVAMITVSVPYRLVIEGKTMEDGYFVCAENLNQIKINSIEIIKCSEIY